MKEHRDELMELRQQAAEWGTVHMGGVPAEEILQVYRCLMENTYFGIALVDVNHKIRLVNSALSIQFGRPISEFIGRECFREFEKREAVCPHCPGTRAMATGRAAEVETEGVRDDGSRFSARIQAFPTFGPDGKVTGFIEIVQDITAPKRAEETLRQRTAQLEALHEVGLELAAELDLDALLRSIVSRAVELLGGNSGAIDLYRPELDALEWAVAVGMDFPSPKPPLRRGEGLCGRVWESGQPLIVDDYHHWEGRRPGWEGYPFQAVMGVPIRWGDEFMGVLQVSAAPPRTFSPADAELLSLFAHQAAIAIRNARVYEEARKRAERLAVVNHIAHAASAVLRLDDLLETVYQEIAAVFQPDAFFIALYDERTNELDYRLRVDEGMREPPQRRPVGTGLTSLVVTERKPLLIRNMEQERDRLPTPHLWGTMKVPASWLGVPMLIGERLVGVISVQAYRPHAYGEEEQQLLSTIADQVAVAFENAQLYAETERRLKEQSALREAGTVISSALDLGTVLHRLAEQMGRAIDATSAYIVRLDPEAKAFTVLAEYFSPQACDRERVSDLGVTYPYAEGDIKFVELMQAGRHDISQLDDPNLPESERTHMEQYGAKTILYIPLRIRDQLVGHVELWESRWRREFTPEEIALCYGIAQQAAIAIENARLFEEEKRRATQLALINEVGDKAASILDLDRLMQEVTRLIQERFNYYNVALLLLDEDRREMVMQAIAGGLKHLAPSEYRQSLDEGIIGFVGRTGQSWLAKDTSKDPYYIKGFVGEVLTRSELTVPIKLGDRVLGALDVQSIHLNDFDESDLVAMEAVADRLAIAIQNARLFEETRRRATQLQTVEEVGRKVSSILDPDQLFPYVVRAIQQNFGYYHVDLFLVDQATGYLVFTASNDPAAEKIWKEQGLRFKIGEEGMVGWVAHTGEPLLANDVSQEPRYLKDVMLPDTKSELVVPLKVGEQVVGVLDVNSDKLNAFDEEDLFVLQTLANQVAIAIENARLYEAEQRRRRDAEALRETALALTSALDRNQVIERILTQLQQVVPYDSASVQLLQEDRLVITGGRGFPNLEELLGVSFPVDGDNPNREVIRTRAPFIVDDAPAVYEGFRRGPHIQTVIRSWLGVPMLIGERVVGMIALDKREPRFYTQEHARLAQTFAAQAAVAIENARLFEEVEKRRVYLEGVLGAAPDAIVTLDAHNRIVEWNPGAERLFGYSRQEAIGRDIDELIAHPDILEEAIAFSRMTLSGKEMPPTETVRYRKDGTPVDVIVAGSPILVEGELIGAVAVYTDITQRKRMEEELRALLLVDELTGLYNRRGFLTLAQQQLKIANRTKMRMALLFADYNGLKQINDTFGHPEGDRALIEVAQVFRETFRESDIIARIGGDEFVVLAMETNGDSAEIIAARLHRNLEAHNARPGRRFKLSLSVGIARYDPEQPCSVDDLVARADRAMYEQKRRKKTDEQIAA